jgi:hypothetical protein
MALMRVFLVIQLLLRFGINTLSINMDSDLNIPTSTCPKAGLVSSAARERKRVANQKYYAKKKAARANDISLPVIDPNTTKGRSAQNKRAYAKKTTGQATHSVACQSDPSLLHDVSRAHDAVTSLEGNIGRRVGDSPYRMEEIHGKFIGPALTTNTNASSCLDSDISLLDALVGEEGQTSARVREVRRTKNSKYYVKRQACNQTQSSVSFIADSVEDRNEFGGIYCRNWHKARELLYTWLEYCKEFFGNAKACANCGKFVFGGKYSMHSGKLLINVLMTLFIHFDVKYI